MEFKGTKTPWVIKPAPNMAYRIVGNTGNAIEDACNAQLIAAAPELLSELRHVVNALKTVSSFGATEPIIKHAEAVISKALGMD